MNQILEKNLALVKQSLKPSKNNNISEFKISDYIFEVIKVFNCITKCGKYMGDELTGVTLRSKNTLQKLINDSYVFVGFNNKKEIVFKKNIDGLVVKFIDIFNMARYAYQNKPGEKEDLYCLYPYGDIPAEQILPPHLGDLIRLEKEQFQEDLVDEDELKTIFYLRDTMLICEKLQILDPLSLMLFQKQKPTIH